MLTLTENASTIVKSITAAQPGPETAGLRISTEDAAQGLTVSTTPEPQPGDQTVNVDGAVVYLDRPRRRPWTTRSSTLRSTRRGTSSSASRRKPEVSGRVPDVALWRVLRHTTPRAAAF